MFSLASMTRRAEFLGASVWMDRSDHGEGISVDGAGNVYVAGRTTGGMDGRNLGFAIRLLLSKYTAAGTPLWTRQLGTSHNAQR